MRVAVEPAIGPLTGEWDALARRVGAPPFLRAGWAAAWWDAFGAGRPAVLCARRGGRLAGLLALRRAAGGLASLTNAHTPGFGMLAEDAAAAAALAAGLFAGRPRRVHLAHLDADDPGLAALASAARAAGYGLLRTPVQRSPFVDLTAGGAPLSAKQASNLRRLRRRLEAAGTVDVEVGDGADRLDEALEEGFRLEASGWKADRRTAIASRPETRRFYERVARWARDEGLLRLAFLRLDGAGIAFELGLQDGTGYHLLKGGYDPAWRHCAPGRLLAHEMIGRAADAGLERFEFLGDAEPWKLEWARACHERVRLHAFAPTPFGAVDRLAQSGYRRYARPLARRVVVRSA